MDSWTLEKLKRCSACKNILSKKKSQHLQEENQEITPMRKPYFDFFI